MNHEPQYSVRRWAAAHERTLAAGRGQGVRIALIDDGVSRRCTPLRNADIVAKDFVRRGPGGAHGTLCAAALVGSSEAYEGLVPDAKLFSARARAVEGGTAPLQAALRWLLDQAPDVVCIPMGRPRGCGRTAALLRRLANAGAQIVAAAGNRNPDEMLFPASCRSVVAVSAVDADGAPTPRCYAGEGAVRRFAGAVPTWDRNGPCTFARTSAATVLEAGWRAAALSADPRRCVS